jgi:uncharacterized membrane protein YjfL (UPF0719 family)
MRKVTYTGAILILLATASNAFAVQEYVTWGGYSAVTQAFSFASNVFANNEYSFMYSAFALIKRHLLPQQMPAEWV